jgi:hypothetical protein
MAKKVSLRERCLAEAPKRKPGGWLSSLPPEMQSEILDIVRDWAEGGEVRKAYSLRALCVWIKGLDEVSVSESTIRGTLEGITREISNAQPEK